MELGPLATLTPSQKRPTRLLIFSMLLTVALVAALAFWDSERQAEATLSDFAQEQATLASSVAADLGNRLQSARRDALLAAEQTLTGQPISPRLREPYLALQVESSADSRAPLSRPENGVLIKVPIDAERSINLRVSLTHLLSGSAGDRAAKCSHPADLAARYSGCADLLYHQWQAALLCAAW